MQTPNGDRSRWWLQRGVLILLIPAVLKLLVQLFTVNGYGLHGDELYYLACSDHLDWGYVDQPPLSILLLHLQRVISGDSLLSIRLLPALAGAFTVLLTSLLARRMGAGTFGQLLAGFCALIAPVYLAIDHYFSMNAFDLLVWVITLYLVVSLVNGGKPTLWLWIGLVVGLGFENKISILFLCFGLAVGLLLTKQRSLIFSRWLVAGVAAALVLMLPNILWQLSHGWPTLEFIANARAHKMTSLSLPAFVKEQLLLVGPMNALVWGAGLIVLLFSPVFRNYRAFGWTYLVVFTTFVLQGGKPYYLTPIYPILLAAGAVQYEAWLKRRWTRVALISVVLISGAIAVPMGIPILPVEDFVTYSATLGLRPSSGERSAEGELPSFFAGMFGWKELTAEVDSVYQSLPEDDQRECAIFCPNYAEAGAIDFYGRRYHLPHAISGHNSYWLWGTRGYSGNVMIVLGVNENVLRKYYDEVKECARFRNRYVQPLFNNLPIYVVWKPKQSLTSLWPDLKNFI